MSRNCVTHSRLSRNGPCKQTRTQVSGIHPDPPPPLTTGPAPDAGHVTFQEAAMLAGRLDQPSPDRSRRTLPSSATCFGSVLPKRRFGHSSPAAASSSRTGDRTSTSRLPMPKGASFSTHRLRVDWKHSPDRLGLVWRAEWLFARHRPPHHTLTTTENSNNLSELVAMARSATQRGALSVGQLARRWGLGADRVRRLVESGLLPGAFKVPSAGKIWRSYSNPPFHHPASRARLGDSDGTPSEDERDAAPSPTRQSRCLETFSRTHRSARRWISRRREALK